MGFGLNLNSGANFLRIVKFDARAGRFFRVDRDEDTGEQVPTDITEGFECVLDLQHCEYGWALFAPGLAPDFRLVTNRRAAAAAADQRSPPVRARAPPASGKDRRRYGAVARTRRDGEGRDQRPRGAL